MNRAAATPTWVDTHCHVYDDRTPGGADGSIANAAAHDVNKVIVIGTDADTTGKALAIEIGRAHV